MNIKEAKKLIAKDDRHYGLSETQVILRGLQILAKYDNNIQHEFRHNMLWVSDFKKTVEQMSETEVLQMAKLGWFCDEFEFVERWSYEKYDPGPMPSFR